MAAASLFSRPMTIALCGLPFVALFVSQVGAGRDRITSTYDKRGTQSTYSLDPSALPFVRLTRHSEAFLKGPGRRDCQGRSDVLPVSLCGGEKEADSEPMTSW